MIRYYNHDLTRINRRSSLEKMFEISASSGLFERGDQLWLEMLETQANNLQTFTLIWLLLNCEWSMKVCNILVFQYTSYQWEDLRQKQKSRNPIWVN